MAFGNNSEAVTAETVTALVTAGAQVNVADNYGNTVHVASSSGYLTIVQFLLEHGANINARNKYGHTALDVAMKDKQVRVGDFLRSHGAK